MTPPNAKVGVVGGGAWGTALAQVAARAGSSVTLWARELKVVADIELHRENRLFLPGVTLHDAIHATGNLADLADTPTWFLVPPAQYLRVTLEQLGPYARHKPTIVLCAKGIEQQSLRLMSQVLVETLPDAAFAVLSGPSFASEVARGLPTAVTLACPDPALGAEIATILAGAAFRPYLSEDVIGVEVGGAIKNVLAIACGIAQGRGLGSSAHAALITRGFAELTRIAVALGGEAETVAGLCGLGDLVLTCSSPQSRNMSLGIALGRGDPLQAALEGKLSVAEGVATAPAVRALTEGLGVEAPICNAVADILAGDIDIESAILGLLSRPLRHELEG